MDFALFPFFHLCPVATKVEPKPACRQAGARRAKGTLLPPYALLASSYRHSEPARS